ncbi:MAG: iron ABC transporter permease [Oscillospiraceae bacterium]|nr:iron ABC transporter permease [Oscillospiraceae bacterium]
MKIRKETNTLSLWIMAMGLLAGVTVSLCLGRYPIGIRELFGILFSRLGVGEVYWSPMQEALLLQHRLPRVLLAVMVGCSLSGAGASYQAVFRNPMAAPDLLGASGGAAFGAALGILLGMGSSVVVLLAFVCSLLTVALVMVVGNRARGKKVVGLILAGIMVSSVVSSGTSFLKLVADPADQLPAITYWLMGSLNGATPRELLFAFIPMILGILPLVLFRWRIQVLTLGDEEARTLGIHGGRLRLIVILSSTLLTAAAVSVSGVIGWVGLIVPHLCRKLVGDSFPRLLPASLWMGGTFLLIVDDLSRLLLATEIPIGILTGFLGAPFFLYLMMKDGEHH